MVLKASLDKKGGELKTAYAQIVSEGEAWCSKWEAEEAGRLRAENDLQAARQLLQGSNLYNELQRANQAMLENSMFNGSLIKAELEKEVHRLCDGQSAAAVEAVKKKLLIRWHPDANPGWKPLCHTMNGMAQVACDKYMPPPVIVHDETWEATPSAAPEAPAEAGPSEASAQPEV
jgi:hypothetical protein